MPRHLFSSRPAVKAAVADYLKNPAYGRQKELAYTYNIPTQTLSQAIAVARKHSK